MSTAPQTEERRISNDNIVLSYCKGNHLYLVFRETIDPDLAPLPVDFSVVDRARPVSILGLDMLQTEDASVVVLLLRDRIRPGSETGVKYRPMQWLMCWEESGDIIEEFEQSVYPEGSNAADLGKFGEPNFEDVAEEEQPAKVVEAASLGYVCDYRIQIKFNPGLDATRAPEIDDFRAEMADRWLKISTVKYDHVNSGIAQDILISLSEPMDVGSRINIAYKSPIHCLRTIKGESIAGFQLEAIVEESTQTFVADYHSAHDDEYDVEAELSLVQSASSSLNSDEIENLDKALSDESSHEHRDAEKILSHDEVVDLVEENFPLLDDVVETDTPEPLPEASTIGKEKAAANDEKVARAAEASATNNAENGQPKAKKEEPEAKPVFEEIDYSKIKPTIPGGIKNPQVRSKTVEQNVPDEKEKTRYELMLTKALYILPIAFTAWLLFVIVIYASIILFDIEMPGSGSIATPAALEAQEQVAKTQPQAAKREPCEIKAEDGGVYKGECLNGVRDGHGVYTWPSGNKYDGQWKNGKQDGLGKLVYNNGAVYTGEFQNGVEHGGGLMRWPNGSQYQGGYQKGIFHGHGEYRSVDGMRYVGVFENGMMTDDGMCFMTNGNRTKGPCNQHTGRR